MPRNTVFKVWYQVQVRKLLAAYWVLKNDLHVPYRYRLDGNTSSRKSLNACGCGWDEKKNFTAGIGRFPRARFPSGSSRAWPGQVPIPPIISPRLSWVSSPAPLWGAASDELHLSWITIVRLRHVYEGRSTMYDGAQVESFAFVQLSLIGVAEKGLEKCMQEARWGYYLHAHLCAMHSCMYLSTLLAFHGKEFSLKRWGDRHEDKSCASQHMQIMLLVQTKEVTKNWKFRSLIR